MNNRIWKQVVLQLACLLPVCIYAQAPAFDRSTLVELAEHRRHEPLEFQQFISNTTNWISLGVPAGLLIGGQLSGNKDMKLAGALVGSGSALLNRQINHWIHKKQHHTEHVVHF